MQWSLAALSVVLVTGEDGLALLVEGGEALEVVVGGAQLALGDVLVRDGLPQATTVVADVLHEGAAGQERAGRADGGLTGLAAGELHELLRGEGTGEQAGGDGLGTGDHVAGDDEVHRTVRTQTLDEQGVPAGVEGGAQVGEGGPEGR